MNPNDDQLDFTNRSIDLLSKHKHIFSEKNVLDYQSSNGFTAEMIRTWGAKSVTARIAQDNMRSFSKKYLPKVDVVTQVSGEYDVIVLTETAPDSVKTIDKITQLQPNYIFVNCHSGPESPHPKSVWEFGDDCILHIPNISWIFQVFAHHRYQCDYVEKYITQYHDENKAFIRFYNTKTVTSTPITIEQAWELNLPVEPRKTNFSWDKFNQIIG